MRRPCRTRFRKPLPEPAGRRHCCASGLPRAKSVERIDATLFSRRRDGRTAALRRRPERQESANSRPSVSLAGLPEGSQSWPGWSQSPDRPPASHRACESPRGAARRRHATCTGSRSTSSVSPFNSHQPANRDTARKYALRVFGLRVCAAKNFRNRLAASGRGGELRRHRGERSRRTQPDWEGHAHERGSSVSRMRRTSRLSCSTRTIISTSAVSR